MSFLNRANTAKAEAEANKTERGTRWGGGGRRIGSLWLRTGDAVSMRIIDTPPEYDNNGQLIRLGNPALIQVTKIWDAKTNRPKAAFINPATFTGINPLDISRDEWFKNEKKKRGPGSTKVTAKDCPLPSTQGRFLLWGLVCSFLPGPNSLNDDPSKKLGYRGFDMSDSTMTLLKEFMESAALSCEEDSRNLTIKQVNCPHCKNELLNADVIASSGLSPADIVTHSDDNFAAILEEGETQCPHCGKSLECAVEVVKWCSKCKAERNGMGIENTNIVIKRVGDKEYTFAIDQDLQGGLEVIPADVQMLMMSEEGNLTEANISYDPATDITTSNFFEFQGLTPADIDKMVSVTTGVPATATARRPTSPLRLTSKS